MVSWVVESDNLVGVDGMAGEQADLRSVKRGALIRLMLDAIYPTQRRHVGHHSANHVTLSRRSMSPPTRSLVPLSSLTHHHFHDPPNGLTQITTSMGQHGKSLISRLIDDRYMSVACYDVCNPTLTQHQNQPHSLALIQARPLELGWNGMGRVGTAVVERVCVGRQAHAAKLDA